MRWDNLPHTVWVQRRKKVKSDRGELVWVPDGVPYKLKADLQPARDWSAAEETHSYGISQLDICRMFSRTWDGDSDTHVYYDGQTYEIIGSPQHVKSGSWRTWHWSITLKVVKNTVPEGLNG